MIMILLFLADRAARYLGPLDPSNATNDLLFVEAIHGDLQGYIHKERGNIPTDLKLKWCKEAAEGLAYCHSRGVLHCDLRLDNILLHGNLSICFCDFGGSKNERYNGGGLPDFGFFDSRGDTLEVTEAMEVFGLGSIFYTIMSGTLPHGPSRLETLQQRLEYYDTFERLCLASDFPDTSQIMYGGLIKDCWNQKIHTAKEAYKCLV